MSDLADDFRALKEHRRKEKEKRHSDSSEAREQIRREALDVEEKNNGLHWIVRTEKETIDFWPTSGRWMVRGNKAQGYDGRSLAKRLTK